MTESDAESRESASVEELSRAAVWRWLFLTGSRPVIAALLLVVLYTLLTVTDAVVGTIFREQTSPLLFLFSALTGGNFTLITIVISITQLIISQQLSTPGELRDQIEATNAYREAIEESIQREVAPVTPTEFLHLLLRDSARTLDDLREHAEEMDQDAREELLDVVDHLEEQIDGIEATLSDADLNLFQALSTTLATNYSEDIFRIRRLRGEHDQAYDEDVYDCLDDLVIRLQQLDVARQYLKTLYIQNELAQISRHLLYVGVPAVFASIVMLRSFAVEFDLFAPELLFRFVPVAVVIGCAPLAVLFAYVLRLSVVAQRTIAITPFTLSIRGDERDIFED